MSPLERRCRLLLLAYPASYSRDRGEEILGTLMEATPERRRRPLLRDVRALVAGGFRARAAQHRRETTAANLRLAALLGVLIYLSLGAFGFVDDFVGPELNPTATFSFGPSGWRALLAGLLLVVVVILVWFGSRSVLVAAALAAAAAVPYSGFTQGQLTGATITELLCLAAVVALAWHSERPSWAWLWLIGVVAVAETLPGYLQFVYFWPYVALGLVLLVLVVTFAWIGVDARPAVAVATYWLVYSLSITLDNLEFGAARPARLEIGPDVASPARHVRRARAC